MVKVRDWLWMYRRVDFSQWPLEVLQEKILAYVLCLRLFWLAASRSSWSIDHQDHVSWASNLFEMNGLPGAVVLTQILDQCPLIHDNDDVQMRLRLISIGLKHFYFAFFFLLMCLSQQYTQKQVLCEAESFSLRISSSVGALLGFFFLFCLRGSARDKRRVSIKLNA